MIGASVEFDPQNPFTWGKGGRAPLITYDPAMNPRGSTPGLVAHIMFSEEYEGKRTLKSLNEFMAQPEASFRQRLARIHEGSKNKFVRDALGPFINLTDATFSGIFKGAAGEIEWLTYDRY